MQNAPIFKLDQFLLWSIFSENAQMDMDLGYVSRPSHRKRDTSHPLAIIRNTSQVCSLWRTVLLHSPSLWAQLIDIEALCRTDIKWRNEVISRTGKSSLNVKGCVRFDSAPVATQSKNCTGEFLLSVLSDCWPRIRRLRVEVMEVGIQSTEISRKRWSVLQRPAPNLEMFNMHFGLNSLCNIFTTEGSPLFSNTAPSLRHLIPTNINFPLSAPCFSRLQSLKLSPYYDVPQILHAFGNMECLESLTLNLQRIPSQDSYPLPHVDLPRLHDVHVSGSTGACMPLLDHIAPAPGCRVFLETSRDALPPAKELEVSHRVLARYAKSYLNAHDVPAVSISIHLSSFTFYTNSITSLNDPASPDFKFKLEMKAEAMSFILSALTECNFSNVKTLYIGSRSLLASDPSFFKIFKSLQSVEEIELTPDGMEFLLSTPTDSNKLKLFPLLRTIKVVPFIVTTNTDMILPFLYWRREQGTPIEVFNLELHPLAGFPMNFAFLEEMKGMSVIWKAGQSSRRYLCGSGDPEELNFKYDPIYSMYDITKLF